MALRSIASHDLVRLKFSFGLVAKGSFDILSGHPVRDIEVVDARSGPRLQKWESAPLGLLDRIKSKLGAGETGTEAAAASERSIETPRKSVASAQVIEEELRLQVANHSQGEFSIDDIPTDAALFDEAFIDSISSVKFLSFIEQNYGVKIKEVALVGNLASIEALAEHILAKCPAPGETEPAE